MGPDPRSFQAPDGTTIAGHVTGDGPPLVLVHGTAADHRRWASILDALAARFTVYALDRRGRPESGDADPYAIDAEFDDVAAVVSALGGSVDLLGHSYGAICALEGALRTGGVRRLVLYEPPLPIGHAMYPPGLLDRLAELLAAGEREAVVTTFLTEVARMPAHELEALRRDPSWSGRVAAAHTIPREIALADGYVPAFERFAELRTPTLLLVGGDSPTFLSEPSRRLAATLPDARLVEMPRQQHVAMTTAPGVFLGHVLEFLTETR